MLESKIEARLRKGIEKLDGKCYKFLSPGNAGMPDRICTFPNAILFFVETKAPGKSLKPLQRFRRKELEAQDFLVFKLDSIEEVDHFLKKLELDYLLHT